MPPVYDSVTRSARMQAVVYGIDAQASVGSLEIGTVGMTAVLVAFPLSRPSFFVSGDVMTMAGAPKIVKAIGTGAAGAARIKDGIGNIVVSGLTVGTSGCDINLSKTAIAVHAQVTLSSATITHG